MSLENKAHSLWTQCGGPFDEISQLVEVLRILDLITERDEAALRTRLGNKISKAAAAGDKTSLGLLLIRAGFFHDQARIIVEQGDIKTDGSLTCPLKIATAGGPQLLGVLAWWPEVQVRPLVVIPANLLGELNTVWALLPPKTELPQSLTDRKAIGDRAEMYTVQFERSRTANPSLIAWVSRDSDTLGWDVEDRTATPYRHIEVKGRRDNQQQFYLSENELRKATELGTAYELQFWGNIDLSRDPAVEYAALRADGYPVMHPNLREALDGGTFDVVPVRWRVSLRDSGSAALPNDED